MAKRAMFSGGEVIKGMFEQTYTPDYCYSIAYAERGDPCYQYFDKDHEKGIDNFNAYIDQLAGAGNDDLLYLRFHPLSAVKASKFIDKKTPVIIVSPIRVCELNYSSPINGVGEQSGAPGTYRMFEAVAAIKSLPEQMAARQTAFEEKMLLLMQPDDDETVIDLTPQPDPIEKYFNMAIGALKQPEILQNVAGLLKMIFPNFNPPIMNNAINGTTDTQQAPPQQQQQYMVDIDLLNANLERLAPHCSLDTDLGLLADIAETNPAMFNMLMGQLRSFKK